MIHLGIVFGLRNAIKRFCKGGREFDLRKIESRDCGSGNGFAKGAHLFRNSSNPICYTTAVGAGHFCPPLTVTRKFRLCIHPVGMLRVQSLHLPIEGLARRFLQSDYSNSKRKDQ